MKSRIALNTLRSIKRTPGRFIAVMAIIAIGCAFFSGVKSACGDMKRSGWKYYQMQQLADIQIKSTLGLTEEDYTAVMQSGSFESGYAGYSADVFVSRDMGDVPVKLLSYSQDDPLNIPYLTEGRLPEKSGECLADANPRNPLSFAVGDTVTFYADGEDDISDILSCTEFTIVGLCKSAQYVSFDRGAAQIGTGSLSGFVFIPEEDFTYEAYTDIYIRVSGANDSEAFSDEYLDIVALEEEKLEALSESRLEIRRSELSADAVKEIEDAKSELEDGREELADAEREYNDGLEEYNSNSAELADARMQYEDGLAEYEDAVHKLEESDQAYTDLISTCDLLDGYIEKYNMMYQRQLFDTTLEDIRNIQAIYDDYGIDVHISDYLAAYIITNPDKDPVGKASAKAAIAAVNEEVRQTAQAAKAARPEQEKQLEAVRIQLEETLEQLEEAEKELAKAKKTLDDAAEEISDGKAELEDAEQEIADAEAELEETLSNGEWYVWNRSEYNPSCMGYGEDAERVDAIAKVFPVFFIIIAALMCSTTMSRMVEEQRTEVGTLKSLGYSSAAIVMQYVLYAVSASVIGSAIGTLIGFQLLPNIIFQAYCTMYNYPIFESPYKPGFALGCLIVSVLCTGLATVYTAYRELGNVPAQLIRPKPPKGGKRIMLERVTFIWSRLKFTSKVTFRNLFRYKSRFLMTVIGVMGSCALMLTGIGLKNSISCIVDLQYDDIFIYDAIGILDEDSGEEDKNEYIDFLESSDLAESYTFAVQKSLDVISNSTSFEAYVFVPASVEELSDYIVMKERKSGVPVILDDSGCVINEKLARILNVKLGDLLYIEGSERALKITGIVENYTYNYCYVTMNVYEEMFGEAEPNIVLINTGGTPEKDIREEFSRDIIACNGIVSLTFMYDGADTFRDLIKSLDLIVFVIIVFAAALSFVILLNLANITVNERERELATIKVLGFYDGEVSAYVYRENVISTLIGIACGLVLGVFLEGFVIRTAEVDAVMFSPDIPVYAFVLAALLMILFAVIVNIILHFKLKKIDMAVSMKAIE